jgi:hypothetical protein
LPFARIAPIVIVAETDFVESVTDVAVTVTVAGFGITPGAVYVVAVPLAVVAAEKLPHVAGAVVVQVTVHFTPAFALSLATFAVMLVVEDVLSDDGGAAANVTTMPGAVIVIVAEADFVGSVTDVAVTVTVAGFGITLGAVYVVAVPLAVEVAEKLPHVAGAVVVQATVHFTPAFALSLATFAVMLVLVDAASAVGGAAANATLITGSVIVIGAETDFVESAAEVAVIVTVAGFGTALGAV